MAPIPAAPPNEGKVSQRSRIMITASALTAAVKKVQLTAPLATVGMVRPAKILVAATAADKLSAIVRAAIDHEIFYDGK